MRQDITDMYFWLRLFLIIVSHQVWQEGAGGGHRGRGEEAEHRRLCRVVPQGGQDHAGVCQVHGKHGQADPLGTFLLNFDLL